MLINWQEARLCALISNINIKTIAKYYSCQSADRSS